ncbi:GNAT family N-acetyltransferase [Nonomuraea zeae]|nr:GNAT family N-acetyltransferase [Nonomuraea zeae]
MDIEEHQTPVRIRPVRDEDRQAVLALAPRLAEGVAAWRDPGAATDAARRWLTDSITAAQDRRGAVFVADGGPPAGGVVGVVSVNRQQHFTGVTDAYVGELAVDPRAVRGGVGRMLMAAAEDWARRQGLRHLTLETGAANTTARQFYAALGYHEEGVRLTRSLEPEGTAS